MNFTEYPWHDAILKEIKIDRSNPGNNDVINMTIVWPTGIESTFCFKDVYYAKLNLNFGVIAEESISAVTNISMSDSDIVFFFQKWKGLIDNIEDLLFIEMLTISTGSEIRIFAKEVISLNE
jgi:hypothetical protein